MLADFNPLAWVFVGFGWVLVLWAFLGVVIWTVDRWPRRERRDQ